MPSYCLREGKSLIKVRPKSELGNWGPSFTKEVFVDTLAPIIIQPDISSSIGAPSITILADSISEDVSQTTDVSTLDRIIFKARKDEEPEMVQEYNIQGSLISPFNSHVFPISPTSDCVISWSIEAYDIAGNSTIVNAYNIFRGIDGQLNITHLFEDLAKIDTGLVIGQGIGNQYIIPTFPLEGIPTDFIEGSEAVIPTDALGNSAISTEQYLNVLSIINTEDVGGASGTINLGSLKESGVIETEQYLQILNIINTTDIGQSSTIIQLSALEEAGIIKTEAIGDTDSVI